MPFKSIYVEILLPAYPGIHVFCSDIVSKTSFEISIGVVGILLCSSTNTSDVCILCLTYSSLNCDLLILINVDIFSSFFRVVFSSFVSEYISTFSFSFSSFSFSSILGSSLVKSLYIYIPTSSPYIFTFSYARTMLSIGCKQIYVIRIYITKLKNLFSMKSPTYLFTPILYHCFFVM